MAKKESPKEVAETETSLVAQEEVSAAIATLPAGKQEAILRLFQQMRPNTEDYGEMTDIRWRPTILSLKQPTTRKAPETAQNGDLYSSDTGRVYTRPLEFVPVYPFTNRARFQPQAMRPDCRSEDEKTSIYGDICDKCNDKPWKDGKRQKCQRTTNIMATTPDLNRIFLLQFRGSSFKQGVAVVSQAVSDGERLHQRIYTVDTRKEEGPQGVYYTLQASYKGAVDEALLPIGQGMYDVLKSQRGELLANIKENIGEGRNRVEAMGDDVGDVVSDETPADFSDL
jgi:hypothetical protein